MASFFVINYHLVFLKKSAYHTRNFAEGDLTGRDLFGAPELLFPDDLFRGGCTNRISQASMQGVSQI
jgi:hypothetical protein